MLAFASKDAHDILNIEGLNSNFSLKLPFRTLNIDPQSNVSFCFRSIHVSNLNSIHFQKLRSVNDEIRQFYFGNDAINMSKLVEYVDLLNDLNFLYPIDKAVKLHASKSIGKTFYARSVFNIANDNVTLNCPIYMYSNLGFRSTRH